MDEQEQRRDPTRLLLGALIWFTLIGIAPVMQAPAPPKPEPIVVKPPEPTKEIRVAETDRPLVR